MYWSPVKGTYVMVGGSVKLPCAPKFRNEPMVGTLDGSTEAVPLAETVVWSS